MSNETRTVLAVDDDIDILEQVALEMKREGYNVVTAEGQAEAEKLIAEGLQFDMAIVDLMMENMDSGFVLCHHIKKKYPGTPVIILTAVVSETGIDFDATTHEERAWVRADALMDKPVRPEQLQREVARLLKG